MIEQNNDNNELWDTILKTNPYNASGELFFKNKNINEKISVNKVKITSNDISIL